MDPKLVEILKSSQTLPSLPAVAMMLVRQCISEDFDVRRVSDLISKDPALAAKVLKTANSSAFSGATNKVSTVDTAFMRLGANTVMTLALSFSLARLKKTAKGAFDYTSYWRRALLSATATKCLAKYVSINAEEMFLVGLFQDIGILALYEVLKAPYGQAIIDAKGDHLRLERLERERFHCDHVEVGAWLVEQWQLPDFISAAVLASHNPARAANVKGERPDMGVCVALSGWIADVWMLPDPTEASKMAAERAKVWLGFERDQFQQLLTEVADAITFLSELFEIKVGSAEALERILDEAREALVVVSLRTAQDMVRSTANANALEQKLQRDALTGVYNRAYLDHNVQLSFENAVDFGRPLSVLFCDIDHFKRVNDTHGHLVGDQALVATAKALSESVRQLDVVARYGGEEFVVVLPGTDEEGAAVVAERIRARVEATEIVLPDGTRVPITVSVGGVTHGANWQATQAKQLLETADACLYAAKQAGRNRVVCHDPSSTEPLKRGG